MNRYSVKMVPPNVAKDIRGIHGGGKDLSHPYYKVDERKGSGKATCRQCGDVIKEGDPTLYFHYAPDGDNEWIRDRGSIHRDDCGKEKGGENDWTKCPKCREQVPRTDWRKHWDDHKSDRQVAARAHVASSNANITYTGLSVPFNTNTTSTTQSLDTATTATITFDAASRTRQLAVRDSVLSELRPQDVPSYHGKPAYETHDGWKVSQITTMGDAKYEGTMLNHCLANRDVHQMMRNHYGLSEDDNSGEFFFPPPPPAAAFHQYFPDASDEFKEHMESRGHSRIMSLRDPDGIPKATWWEPQNSAPGTEIREVSGFENQAIKDKHTHRIFQYHRHSLEAAGQNTGKFEHCGALPEGMEQNDEDQARAAAEFRYEPILTTHLHDLPTEDANFQGQEYPRKQVTAHCGQCAEDREIVAPVVPLDSTNVPVPEGIPKSLRDRFMNQLGVDKEIDLKVPKAKEYKTKLPGEEGVPFLHEGAAYPKDEDEMREHMRTDHAMDDDADKFPDAALGVIHDSDHEGNSYGHSHEDLSELDKEFDSPEVNRDLSEMKGKEIGENLWNGIKDILGEPATHCPECGTHETTSQGTKTDEDGWDYEGMKCDDCGKEFDKDESGSGMNFTLTTPQVYHDSTRNRDRKANFKGNCLGCGKKTFAFEDGENDPRGPLGEHAASPVIASDNYKTGPDVPLCFNCANDFDSYKKALNYGERIWEDDPSQKHSWKVQSENEAPEATVSPAPMGYKPRVDPYSDDARKKAEDKTLNDEVAKLQKNLKTVDQFAGARGFTVRHEGAYPAQLMDQWKGVEVVAGSPFGKELKKVRNYAEDLGWRVNETKKGWQFLAPPELIQPGFSGIVTTHASPSDHRAFKNFLTDMKNHGGLVWPPEKARQKKTKEHDPLACLQAQGISPAGLGGDEVLQLHDLAHEGELGVA